VGPAIVTIEIRALPQGERHALAPLLTRYAREMRPLLAGSAAIRGEDAARLLEDDPRVIALGAFDDASPVGFAIVFEVPEVVFARRCGALDDVFVVPERRGKGIARRLIAAAAETGRERGWSHLRWIVPEGDVAAIALYERIAERADWRSYVIRLAPDASL